MEKNESQTISIKPVFHLATLFARRKAKTRIWHRDWLKLAGEKIPREQVATVPTFLSVRANKVAKWKTGLTYYNCFYINMLCCALCHQFTISLAFFK